MKKVILVLSHRGQSFLQEWAEALEQNGFSGYVLSSKPAEVSMELKNLLDSTYLGYRFTEKVDLEQKDIATYIDDLNKNGVHISAVVTIWEAYRGFMGQFNNFFNLPDLMDKQVDSLRDKLWVRKILKAEKHSSVNAEILSPERLIEFQKTEERWFLKPRFGIASFGAFPLTKDIKWSNIQELQSEMATDPVYKSFFAKDPRLIVETLVSGREFSLEVFAANGKNVILAVHEKIETESKGKTTLENACVSPPFDLSEENKETLQLWLDKTFHFLNVWEGAFHIEVKLHENNWELIEVNPRVGGAYILESTRQVSGINMLSAWLQLLTEVDCDKRGEIIETLKKRAAFSSYQNCLKKISFFRVYFADSGKTVLKVETNNSDCEQPTMSKCFLKPQTVTCRSSREIFLGQALWNPRRDPSLLKQVLDKSKTFFNVCYVTREQL